MKSVPKPQRTVLADYREWIGRHPCCACWPSIPPGERGQVGQGVRQSEACHVRSRGAGGDDPSNLLPMCHWHHIDVQHLRGWGALWAAHPDPDAALAHAQRLATLYFRTYVAWRAVHPPGPVPAW